MLSVVVNLLKATSLQKSVPPWPSDLRAIRVGEPRIHVLATESVCPKRDEARRKLRGTNKTDFWMAWGCVETLERTNPRTEIGSTGTATNVALVEEQTPSTAKQQGPPSQGDRNARSWGSKYECATRTTRREIMIRGLRSWHALSAGDAAPRGQKETVAKTRTNGWRLAGRRERSASVWCPKTEEQAKRAARVADDAKTDAEAMHNFRAAAIELSRIMNLNPKRNICLTSSRTPSMSFSTTTKPAMPRCAVHRHHHDSFAVHLKTCRCGSAIRLTVTREGLPDHFDDNDNDHSFSRLSVRTALACPCCQRAWALVTSLIGEKEMQTYFFQVLLLRPRATWNEVGLRLCLKEECA